MTPFKGLVFCITIALAILIPTFFFPNINEKYPIVVFLTTPILFLAGSFVAIGGKIGDWKSWVGWALFVGLVVASIIHFTA